MSSMHQPGQNRQARRAIPPRRSARGFTVIELGVVLVIIVLLVSIVFAGLRIAFLNARVSGEQQVLTSIKLAIHEFEEKEGFLPPMLKEDLMVGPIGPSTKAPVAWTKKELEQRDMPLKERDRYSVCSLAYYLVGATDAAIDGVDGPGFTQVRADGTFDVRGRKYEALFDANRDRPRLFRDGVPGGLKYGTNITIVDRWHHVGDVYWLPNGIPPIDRNGNEPDHPRHAIRYYRWEPTYYRPGDSLPAGKSVGDVKSYNIPRFLGDADKQPALRLARYALVSAGPDSVIVQKARTAPYPDEEDTPDSAHNKDNLVEFGP